ncbi:phospholipase B1, membrane-associated-like [Austrofundulus limnaeus]|uniref:Phospholipase B1, membrane-associated-like n=1 Tax=Austrofundulus limnaeus TaxID=52670 RepID=A0A2I4CT54_AUSLI|nr:PREDICTED: phospholipase B1, membrane-associated-like [Austrofundulus limnaeus]
MKRLLIVVVLCGVVSCSVTENALQQDNEVGIPPNTTEAVDETNPKKAQTEEKRHPLFQCPDMSPSPSVPTSVEFVKPADVKVIAALGDSWTTAFGANASSVFGLALEFRHLSWSIGGHRTCQDVITLPNILKLFNPDLIGASSGMSNAFRKTHIKDAGFNLAVTGDNTS